MSVIVTPEQQAFSLRQVGRMLGCSPQTVSKLIETGKLAKLDAGEVRRVMVPRWSIEEYLDASRPPGIEAVTP